MAKKRQVLPPYTDVPLSYGIQAPPGPNPQQQQQPQVVIVQQPEIRTLVITPMAGLGPKPLQTKCPSCQQTIRTRVQKKIASKAHISALLMFLFCCWPCACIPYCMDTCKNTDHYCTNCKAYIGTFAAA